MGAPKREKQLKVQSLVRASGVTLAMASLVLVGCRPTTPGTPTPPPVGSSVKGPAPTTASVEAVTGPFAITSTIVPAGNGFGGGTIYAPTATDVGRYSAVAVMPGFIETQSAIAWYGPRVASQGFVVFTLDAVSNTDVPTARAAQLKAALTYLTTQSTVAARVDAGRLGVMGHSMGGGASFEAAAADPGLKAAIPLAPWNSIKSFATVSTPTLVIGCQSDTIAPVAEHASPQYESLPAGTDKAYVELTGADHFCVNSPNTIVAKYTVSWLKRFLDDDTRYSQFLCPPPTVGGPISDYRSNCPY